MRKLLADLRAVTGPAHVLAEADVVAGYATDWTRRYAGIASCVVSPGCTSEVADVIRACAAHGTRIVPPGNLHVNALGPDPADTDVDAAVARLAAAGPWPQSMVSAGPGPAGSAGPGQPPRSRRCARSRRRSIRLACSTPASCSRPPDPPPPAPG